MIFAIEMKSAIKAIWQPTVACMLAAFICCALVVPTHGQDACSSPCVRSLYAQNCGGAGCIAAIGSSQDVTIRHFHPFDD